MMAWPSSLLAEILRVHGICNKINIGREKSMAISWIWLEQSSELDDGLCATFYIFVVLSLLSL